MPAKLILVVEDDADIRDLLQEYLEVSGYEVLAAGNGREALTLLEDPAIVPGLVLVDRNMELMDGPVFLDAIAANPQLKAKQLPVVMMSAAGVIDESRAVAFLRKPFNFDELLEVVAKHCRAPAGA